MPVHVALVQKRNVLQPLIVPCPQGQILPVVALHLKRKDTAAVPYVDIDPYTLGVRVGPQVLFPLQVFNLFDAYTEHPFDEWAADYIYSVNKNCLAILGAKVI